MKGAVEAILGKLPHGDPQRVSGGCIHECFRWGAYFIKSNAAEHAEVFAAEADSLQIIATTGTIRTPEVVATGSSGDTALLILEHLELHPNGDEGRLGEALAALHRHIAPDYGLAVDNFIGSTPQRNTPQADWPSFFVDHRLGPMFDRLEKAGIVLKESQQLLDRMNRLLPHHPPASLLHGDLWGGNRAFLKDGTPVLFDPACYHGHAACDLAMTRLFGGFGATFYDAYRSSAADGMDDPSLHDLYNLYHLLNHALLFGGGYTAQASHVIQRFC